MNETINLSFKIDDFEVTNSRKEHKEMDKLELYLKNEGFLYTRSRYHWGYSDWDQINVFNKRTEELVWDAICHEYSYGYEQGLIEIMDHSYEHGLLTKEELEIDRVLGYLTADEIIERIENNYKFLDEIEELNNRLAESGISGDEALKLSEELHNRLAESGVSGEKALKLSLEFFSPEKQSL